MSGEENLVSKLENLLETMKEWERKPVLKSGRIIVELVKIPGRKTRSTVKPERLAIMVRREDAFRGTILETPDDIEDVVYALSSEKVKELAVALKELYRRRRLQEFEL